MHKFILKMLTGSYYGKFMSEETVTTVVVETPPEGGEEKPDEKTVSEQATEIIDTAKDLAKEISKSDEMIALMFAMLGEMQTAVAAIREDILSAFVAVNIRLEGIAAMIEEVDEEIKDDAPPPEIEKVADVVEKVPEQVVTETDVEKPQKRSRKWL